MLRRTASGRWRLNVFALVLAAWGTSPPAAADEPRKVALLVGINKYDRRKLEANPLQFAECDVQELAAVLKGQGFDVRTLTGADATKAHIDDALTALLTGRRKDVVLVGFAGHGIQMNLLDDKGNPARDDQGQALSDAFFCPFDAVVSKGSTMISLTRLIERLDNEGGTNLFLVDACREETEAVRGLGKRSLSGDELIGRLPANSAILFSCSKGQQALEHASAGGGHGVFFHHVIEGLRGAAADPETGEVGWDDLVGYVRKRVNRTARALDPKGAEAADERFDGRLQTPHELRNLVATPILARRTRDPKMARPVDAPDRAKKASIGSGKPNGDPGAGDGKGNGFGLARFGDGEELIGGFAVKVGDPQFTLLWNTDGADQPTQWQVRVKHNGQVNVYHGKLSRLNERSRTYSLTVHPPGAK